MFKKIFSLPVLIAGVLTALICYLFFGGNLISTPADPTVGRIVKKPKSDTAFGQIFYHPKVNDSLPYFEYRRISDSIKREKDKREFLNKGMSSGGHSVGGIGISKINNPGEENPRYYFTLEGYELEPYARFFVQNGNYNLAYVNWDSTIDNGSRKIMYGHYERKQIPVRYSESSRKLMIPISEKGFHRGKILLKVMSVVTLFALIYFFLGLPIKILIRVAKGDAFNPANIRRFKLIGFGFIIIWALKLGFPYVLKLMFSGVIPSEFTLEPFLWSITRNPVILFLGIASLIISAAFKKGYNLQQDQALTI